jgi:hypothetical protein
MSGWKFSELDQAAMDLTELATSRGWGVLKGLLDAERASVDERLTQGVKPLEQAEYALLHGQRAGLDAAEAAIQAVLAKHVERRDDEQVAVGAAAGSETHE